MKAWEALKALQEGKKVSRKGWDKSLYIYNDRGIVYGSDGLMLPGLLYVQDEDWEIYDEHKPEVKVGQIWENKLSGKIFCITGASKRVIYCIRKDGFTGHQYVSYFFENSLDLRLVVEYPTWEEAVNSKEWKEGK